MAYRLKTYRVQFVAESVGYPTGSPCRASEDADRIPRNIYGTLDADKEHFLVLTLNNKNRVNGFKVVSTGSLTASLVHPREVWRAPFTLAPLLLSSCTTTQAATLCQARKIKKSRGGLRKRATC